MAEPAALQALLDAADEHGGLQTDDVLALVLPLLREVAALHAQEQVAALGGVHAVRQLESGALALARPDGQAPRRNPQAVARVQAPPSSVLRVVGESRLSQDDERLAHEDLQVLSDAEALPARPVHVPDFRAWEQRLDHHDALSDILCLGQVLAALSLGLDFGRDDELRRFAAHRENLFLLQPRLHPVVAAVIVEMTAPDRHQRSRDLPSVIRRLESYREQPQDLAIARVAAAEDGVIARRRAVQTHLRDRLFDLSRRNRLLHFRPTQSSINLTVASVPLVVDLKSIRRDQLCVWGGAFAEQVLRGDRVALAGWLRFEDQPYLPGALDRIIQEARRDRADYGFSQLSLVLAFLRWHDLKEARDERIVSPLLLLPVDLARKKGVRDQYLLQADSAEAEVNPVLRQQLRQLYGIVLPETVGLTPQALEDFHAGLQAQIAATEPGVQLRLLREPEIELIHQRAKQRLEQFRRRQGPRPAAVAPASATDFSYAADDFRPLGLKLFHDRVVTEPLPLRAALGAAPVPRAPQMADEAQATTFALREPAGNPYLWDLDLAGVTLGNFNYRKMSLVRDYNALIDADLPNPAFDRVFSLQPRALDGEPPPALPPAEQWAVVEADATQTAAVGLARRGTSYIIQGPPGTGKSQTITNLVADHLGRGKRVLFVCEKRAAIDVVFHRLRQQGLDELCCMIHDSQADKKAFVQNLRQTYEQWLASADELDGLQAQRQALLAGVDQDLQALQRFEDAMRAVPEHAGLSARALIDRLLVLPAPAEPLSPRQREALPPLAAWRRHAGLVQRLQQTLHDLGLAPALAHHVFARLGAAVLRHERPLARLDALCERGETLLDHCGDALAAAGPAGAAAHADDLRDIVAQAAGLHALQSALAAAAAAAQAWHDKPDAALTRLWLAQAQRQERSPLRWLQPSWWRLSRALAQRGAPAGQRPSESLAVLQAEQQAGAALQAAQQALRGAVDGPSERPRLQALQRWLAQAPEAIDLLVSVQPEAAALEAVLQELLADPQAQPLEALGTLVRDLREQADTLPELLPLLRELADADPQVAAALRTLALPADEIEQAVTLEALARIDRSESWLPRFDGATLARHAGRLAAAQRRLLGLNARVLRAGVRRRFLQKVQRAGLPAAQLDAEGKAFKKAYNAGRRELEHEFGKTMRFKSIREIASADSGEVVRDMKPVWLMSPLSVSDTLPLAADLFDVVIFDEASQIPVEEAVPALYRAPQVIVVGDEMQLPPTSFFASSREDGDDALAVEEDGERFAVVLDADSLLNQGARNLPATLLAWHYRSRYESLIGFSNAAFYAGNLFTIPDRSVPAGALPPIEVASAALSAEAAGAGADALLGRAISFHAVTDGVYAQRRNEGEARYIAQLVRELLQRGTGHSIGLVAFSEAQQGAIEAALEALAADDPDFAARLEAETTREEDDQFCGLFVKNLENVQGDERDIIVLSICYGRGPDGRMLMNFGPINQRGGEKRLNVIFSRARQHMAVVSSIRHEAITNDYNEGAAALKHFLRYAALASRGERAAAQQVLEGLNPMGRRALGGEAPREQAVVQLAAALRARGHAVDERVGQSRFRCDLALREAGAAAGHYALAVLVDTASHDAGADVLERYVSRPRILGGFGWRVVQVPARDWWQQPQAVLDAIERALTTAAQAPDDAAMDEVDDDAGAPAAAPPPAPVAAPPGPSATPRPGRRFEFTVGGSAKFWQIARDGSELTVLFGRIGSAGQAQTKRMADPERAQREFDKLVAEKLKKGYIEVGGG